VDFFSLNTADRVTREIQASECGMNTRLAYPHGWSIILIYLSIPSICVMLKCLYSCAVQLFALFQYNHKEDNYHGCVSAQSTPLLVCRMLTSEHFNAIAIRRLPRLYHIPTTGGDGSGLPQFHELFLAVSLSPLNHINNELLLTW
jgi:hypothetical protein